MKQFINEIKRMQKLAGIINESRITEADWGFSAEGWTARIKEIAEEMGYKVTDGMNESNVDVGALKAVEDAKKGDQPK